MNNGITGQMCKRRFGPIFVMKSYSETRSCHRGARVWLLLTPLPGTVPEGWWRKKPNIGQGTWKPRFFAIPDRFLIRTVGFSRRPGTPPNSLSHHSSFSQIWRFAQVVGSTSTQACCSRGKGVRLWTRRGGGGASWTGTLLGHVGLFPQHKKK